MSDGFAEAITCPHGHTRQVLHSWVGNQHAPLSDDTAGGRPYKGRGHERTRLQRQVRHAALLVTSLIENQGQSVCNVLFPTSPATMCGAASRSTHSPAMIA